MSGKYPYPDDCTNCDGQKPCAEHVHLAEPDNERGHKEAK